MKNSPDAQRGEINHLTIFRIFRDVFCVGGLSLVALISPFLLGKYFGYGWGLLAAIADIGGWFYLDRKYFRQLARSTRLISLLCLAYFLFAALFQGAHFLSLTGP